VATRDERRQILVIEDDPTIAAAVADRLGTEGFDVAVAYDGVDGLAQFEARRPDLVVLDLMLPGMDGLEVCRRIQRDENVPVLMLTSLDGETDTVVGLAVGADDYVTKPFSPRELVARVKAIIRRFDAAEAAASTSVDERLTVGTIEIDRARRRVWQRAEEVSLTATEFDLLLYLANPPGAVRTREQLLLDVWGYKSAHGARTVDSHIRGLRRKLGADSIRTVQRIGYALQEERPA
jgi:DNA-binding response OmpR family regulator